MVNTLNVVFFITTSLMILEICMVICWLEGYKIYWNGFDGKVKFGFAIAYIGKEC